MCCYTRLDVEEIKKKAEARRLKKARTIEMKLVDFRQGSRTHIETNEQRRL